MNVKHLFKEGRRNTAISDIRMALPNTGERKGGRGRERGRERGRGH